MWQELDNNAHEKVSKHHSKDQDLKIDIDVSVNGAGIDCCPAFGAGARRESALNLCDVASGIVDMVAHGRSVVAASAGVEAFREFQKSKEEPQFIDCEWGRLLEQNRKEMKHQYGKIGAALRSSDK